MSDDGACASWPKIAAASWSNRAIRTPGRGDFGRFGLKDAKTGREVFGFGKKGLTATPEEIAAFLRGNAAATWKSSVGSAKRRKPRPAPKPKPEPKLVLRDATARGRGTCRS